MDWLYYVVVGCVVGGDGVGGYGSEIFVGMYFVGCGGGGFFFWNDLFYFIVVFLVKLCQYYGVVLYGCVVGFDVGIVFIWCVVGDVWIYGLFWLVLDVCY